MVGSGFTPTNTGRKIELRLYIKIVTTKIAAPLEDFPQYICPSPGIIKENAAAMVEFFFITWAVLNA